MKVLPKIAGFAFFFALIALMAQPIQAQSKKAAESGIHFHHGTFAEALAIAKAENKLVFVDAYAQWCGPCKMMQYKVFPNAEVGKYFNANFVNIKMDMEKGEGRTKARDWGIRGYPTLIVFNADGKQVYRVMGGLYAPDFIKFGKSGVAAAAAAVAADPSKR